MSRETIESDSRVIKRYAHLIMPIMAGMGMCSDRSEAELRKPGKPRKQTAFRIKRDKRNKLAKKSRRGNRG